MKEERPDWYHQLEEKVVLAAKMNAQASYPYGSELYIDQTPHNQLEALMVRYGYTDKVAEAFQITKTLRNGHQPAWLLYGNEKRGNVCCWYATPFNTRVLYDAFDATGDVDYLHLGYGGLSSFLSTLRRDGAAYGWFLCWPDRTGFDTRSLDTDMDLYGYLLIARSYVLEENGFGLVGFGCMPDEQENILEIDILDGVGRSLTIVPLDLKIEYTPGGLKHVSIDRIQMTCEISFKESADDIENTIFVTGSNTWKIRVVS